MTSEKLSSAIFLYVLQLLYHKKCYLKESLLVLKIKSLYLSYLGKDPRGQKALKYLFTTSCYLFCKFL